MSTRKELSLLETIPQLPEDAEYRPGFMELLPRAQESSEAEENRKLRVAFTLLPGFTLTAFAGFVDALRLAGDVGDRSLPRLVEWTLVGKDTLPVTSSCGAAIAHNATFREPGRFDCLVVVGGIIRDDDYYVRETLDYIQHAANENLLIVGLCNGVFALAKAGVLEGHQCCVHGYHIQEFQENFPRIDTVINQIFVEDRNILSCAGGTAAIDAAGHVIDRFFGTVRARKFLPHMLVDELRQANHPQLSFVEGFFEVHDERVRLAVFLMQLNLSTPIEMRTIARAIGIKPRQLERAFRNQLCVSPSQFYRKMRLDRARWYLSHTNWTVTNIAFECGFSDTSHLTRAFKAEFDQLPSQYRSGLRAASPNARKEGVGAS